MQNFFCSNKGRIDTVKTSDNLCGNKIGRRIENKRQMKTKVIVMKKSKRPNRVLTGIFEEDMRINGIEIKNMGN